MSYIKRRLSEKSTWIAIGAGIPAAAILPSPWSAVMVIVTIVGVLAPLP